MINLLNILFLAQSAPVLNFQEWMENIGVANMVIKGIIIGICVSAPMGPVGIMVIKRTLNKGKEAGFATGCGAALSDFVYAIITGLGVSFVMELINNPLIGFWIKVAGTVMFFLFGLWTYRSNPAKTARQGKSSEKKGEKAWTDGPFLSNFISGFFITVSNPLIVLLFVALFGQFTFILPNNIFPVLIGYVCLAGGALLWWFVLTWVIDKIRERFDLQVLVLINRIIGSVVMVATGIYLIYTLTGNAIPISW